MSWETFHHEAMATHFEIAIAGSEATYARQAAAAAFREIDRLERELSRFVETSDVARVNRAARGAAVSIGSDLLECLLLAADVALATDGAFDAAFRSSGRDAGADGRVPFLLDEGAHTLTPRAERLVLDLGAIGKGYALDRAADVLREWTVNHACLVAGGSTALALDAPEGFSGWPVGIGDAPDVRSLSLTRCALSASGTAVQGAHLLDPRTGAAAKRAGRTWALADTGALSDALSTAFFVMTDDAIAAFCAQHPTVGAAVTASGTLVAQGTLLNLLASR